MAYNRNGYYQRAAMIQAITRRHYEPERQDRCYAAVWRRYIRPAFGICYATYLHYLKVVPPPEAEPDDRQLSLFEERGPKP